MGMNPATQVARGCARKRHGEDTRSFDSLISEQPANALLDRRRLARSRAGDDADLIAAVVGRRVLCSLGNCNLLWANRRW
jgi:hypothetical protein